MKLSRLLAIPATAGAMLLAQIAGISPANASVTDVACNYDYVNFNACLNFQGTGVLNRLTAHVGEDAAMSQTYAQEIINNGAQFRAWLWAGHGSNNHVVTELTLLPGWPAAGPTGLGAELSAPNLYTGDLNENPNGEDRVWAVVSYFDYHIGRNVVHNTGIVRGEFAPVSEGGGGCLIVCPRGDRWSPVRDSNP
jgi:hypothetical protein